MGGAGGEGKRDEEEGGKASRQPTDRKNFFRQRYTVYSTTNQHKAGCTFFFLFYSMSQAAGRRALSQQAIVREGRVVAHEDDSTRSA